MLLIKLYHNIDCKEHHDFSNIKMLEHMNMKIGEKRSILQGTAHTAQEPQAHHYHNPCA